MSETPPTPDHLLHKDSLRNYCLVTLGYWGFMLSDGALRMLVLLHFHTLGYSASQLVILFLLYEFLGILTNLFGGMIAARLGIKPTLVAGLVLQILVLFAFTFLNSSWSLPLQLTFVSAIQGISGVAKDLCKVSAKSSIRLLLPNQGQGRLFRGVAIITGSKNALKGIGYFVGGALLNRTGFESALQLMAVVLVPICCGIALFMASGIGQAKSKAPFRQIFAKSPAINRLSAARVFLFGARDVWFVVGLPLFLSEVLQWPFVSVGAYLAIWIIGYGGVQAIAPKILRHHPNKNDTRAAVFWGSLLTLVPLSLALILHINFSNGLLASTTTTLYLLVGLGVFGLFFAINSSLHSYLILLYSEHDQIATKVGFYYMANAMGRLIGTVLSGLMYQYFGIVACLLCASGMLACSTFVVRYLPDTRKYQRTLSPKASAQSGELRLPD